MPKITELGMDDDLPGARWARETKVQMITDGAEPGIHRFERLPSYEGYAGMCACGFRTPQPSYEHAGDLTRLIWEHLERDVFPAVDEGLLIKEAEFFKIGELIGYHRQHRHHADDPHLRQHRRGIQRHAVPGGHSRRRRTRDRAREGHRHRVDVAVRPHRERRIPAHHDRQPAHLPGRHLRGWCRLGRPARLGTRLENRSAARRAMARALLAERRCGEPAGVKVLSHKTEAGRERTGWLLAGTTGFIELDNGGHIQFSSEWSPLTDTQQEV